MHKSKIYSFSGFAVVLLIIWIFSDSGEKNEAFSGIVKISLREVGNQLLLSQQDSTSLVLPVVAVGNATYQLSFQQPLSFLPNRLVSIVDSTFKRADLPANYQVEVIQCTDQEVAYSYRISADKEETIIPCSGRLLPENCYSIAFKFNRTLSFLNKDTLVALLMGSIVALFVFVLYPQKQAVATEAIPDAFTPIGSFHFFPAQHKLVKDAVAISLSNKECELLVLFVARPNQIIKRDELTKKVWEDHGVIVGRSLDTYISKLRKKLKADDTVTLTNVHGVGYKLEIPDGRGA